jgi:uncharacterized protein (TIGR02594 family)
MKTQKGKLSTKRIYSILLLILISTSSISQEKIFSKEDLTNNRLTFKEKRIQNSFIKEDYRKCISKSSKLLNKGNIDRVAYYYLALSSFKIYEDKLNEFLFDRTLKYLKNTNLNKDKIIVELKVNDKILLDFIHQEAIALSKQDWNDKHKSRAIRRMKYVADIFEDTMDIYKTYLVQQQEYKHKAINKIQNIQSKLQHNIEVSLVADFIIDYVNNNTNTISLSAKLIEELGLDIDVLQAKVLDISTSEYGIIEYSGKRHNPQVVKYFKETGYENIKDDETSWCAAYMNWCAKKAGLDYPNNLLARSWLEIGEEVKSPQLGDIVVFWRDKKNSWTGHVSLFIYKDEKQNKIYCLGGNQNEQVCIAPYSAETVLAYRRFN